MNNSPSSRMVEGMFDVHPITPRLDRRAPADERLLADYRGTHATYLRDNNSANLARFIDVANALYRRVAALSPSRPLDPMVCDVTQEDVTAFVTTLRGDRTPWSDGCASVIEKLWLANLSPAPSMAPMSKATEAA